MSRSLSTLSPYIRVAQVAVLIGLVALLWWSVDWRASADLLAAADLRWLVAAGLVLSIQTVLSALRWRISAARLGITLTPTSAIREYYLSQVVNQSLPGGILGDANRALRARAQAGLFVSGQAVIFERVAGQLGLLTVLILGLIGTVVAPTGVTWPFWLLAPVATGVATVICVPILALVGLRLFGVPDTGLRRVISSFADTVFAPTVRSRQIALSLATAICNVAAFALCAAALGIVFPTGVSAVLVPLILFAMVVPLSISGWGLREGAAAALFPLAGATAAEGLAASVAFGLVFLATVLPGLLVPWLRPNAPFFGQPRATFKR